MKHFLPKLGQIQLAGITPLHVEQLVQERLKKVAAKTLVNELGLLRTVFSLAIENDLIDRCPVRRKHRPKVIHSEKPAWTPDEVRRILAALPRQHWALFACGALTGLRVGELLALTWGNIDFGERTINVQNSLWNGQIVRPKTEASVRRLYAGPMLMNILREQ